MFDKKGQLFSLELVFTVLGFILMVLFIFSTWTLYSTRMNENIASEELQLQAFQLMDLLTKTKGEPTNWEEDTSTLYFIGLASDYGELDAEKVNTFINMDYNLTKKSFNLERFDYSFRIWNINGSIESESGIQPTEISEQNIAIIRFIHINNETKKIDLVLWG